MRILHVVTLVDDQMGSGGPLTVALNHCAELRRRGHDAQLLAGWRGLGEPPTQLEGVPTHLFRSQTRLAAWTRRSVTTFDLMHVHLSRDVVPLVAASLAERAAVPYLVQSHGGLSPAAGGLGRLADHALTGPVISRASVRLAGDPAERAVLAELLGETPAAGDITLHTPAVALPQLTGGGLDGGLDVGGPLDVVFVGRLDAAARPMLFAQAALGVLSRGVDADFSLIGPDGGELARVQELLRSHGELGDRVRYQGPMDHLDVLDRLARADLFVLTGTGGSHSMVMLEALAAGAATVCTSDYGQALTLRSRKAARVVNASPGALAEAITGLAAAPAERAELGRRGRAVVAHQFEIGAASDRLEDLYAQTLIARFPASERVIDLDAAPGPPAQRRPIEEMDEAPGERELDLDQPPAPFEGTDRLLWVASEVTPHRLALWREVARLSDLTVALLASNRANWRLQLDSATEPFHVVQMRAPSRSSAHGVELFDPPRALRSLIRRRPDAVVLDGWESPAFLAAARWARRAGVAVVASYRTTGADAEPAAQRGQRRLLRRADAVLAGGAGSVSAAIGMGVPADRIALNHEPVSEVTSTARTTGSIVDVRDGHRFVFLGPLITRTNTDGLIRAFRLARGMGDQLVIAGSGPMYPALVRLVEELGLTDSVVMIEEPAGAQRAAMLADAHTLVLPSTDEVWGQVVTDALDAGRNVVVSTACAVAGSIADRPEVFVAEPTPPSLSRAMMLSRQRWNLVRAEQLAAQPLSLTLDGERELALTSGAARRR